MPLLELSGDEAVTTRKGNKFATWGSRLTPNRVEPITTPAFHVPFIMEPGEKIFTVGSCFARNVETELLRRGFSLPMRELLGKDEFIGIEAGVVNNFGTPSIYNEFAWALGETTYQLDDHIIEVQKGKYVDLHVISSIRPDTRDVVVARRRAITKAYESVRECRVVIMTLGLVEIWYDAKTGYYLNSAPRPTMLRNEPYRFKLHVLSFEEAYRSLEDALLLIRKHGRPDLRIVLTISPVPLATTHRPEDVIVANSYSKSALRAVAETIVLKHDFVSYFPSYESVMMSDRRLVWRDDLIHVTDETVAFNIGRMVDAFIRSDYSASRLKEEIESGGVVVAVEKARGMRNGSTADAETFFADFGALSSQSVDFAIEHAQFLIDRKEYEFALNLLASASAGGMADQAVLLAADALLKLGRPQEAYDKLNAVVNAGAKSSAVWNALLRAAKETSTPDLVLAVLGRWSRAAPSRSGRATALVGRWFHERGEFERAENFLRHSTMSNPEDALARIYLVELLLAIGRMSEASSLFATIDPRLPNEKVLFERLAKTMPTAAVKGAV